MCAASGITSCFETDIFSLPFFFDDHGETKEEIAFVENGNEEFCATKRFNYFIYKVINLKKIIFTLKYLFTREISSSSEFSCLKIEIFFHIFI